MKPATVDAVDHLANWRGRFTDREMAQTKLDVLDRFPVRIFGAVINDVTPGRMYGSYSYYMSGYEYQNDGDEVRSKKLLGTGRTNGGR